MRIAKFIVVAVLVSIAVPKSIHTLGALLGAATQSIVPPTISSISPSVVRRGASTTVTVFVRQLEDVTDISAVTAGVTVTLLDRGVDANGFTSLIVRLEVAADAEGELELRVTAPAGTTGRGGLARIASGSFREIRTPQVDRAGATLTKLLDGRALLIGGTKSGIGAVRGAEVYDPQREIWSAAGLASDFDSRHTATLLPNGSVLVVGVVAAQLWDPISGSWTVTEPKLSLTTPDTATLLPDGTVFVTGFNTAEIYNPSTGTWSAEIPPSSLGSSATLLPDGTVLVAAGTEAEIFNPIARSWSTTTGSSVGTDGALTVLPDGQVLADAELFDPDNQTWSPTAGFSGTGFFSRTLLMDGNVLMINGGRAGGFLGRNPAIDTELFSIAARTWWAEGTTAQRYRHAAVLLDDGSVLLTSGQGALGVNNRAQLYEPFFAAAPVPRLDEIAHAATVAGKLVGVYLTGDDFVANSSARLVHGPDSILVPETEEKVRTIYLGQNKLLAFVSTVNLPSLDRPRIRVVNPGPGGGVSRTIELDSGAVVGPATLSLTGIDPPALVAGRSVEVSLRGTGLGDATLVPKQAHNQSANGQVARIKFEA